jgi:hypothetical protein
MIMIRSQRRAYDTLVGPVIAGLKGYLKARKMGVPFEKVGDWIGGRSSDASRNYTGLR